MAASLCWPLALFCYFVCVWRWSFDLSWTERFLVADGLLFHWQVWCVAGAALQFLAVRLSHYAGPLEDVAASPPEPRIPITAREVEHAGRA